MSFLYLLAFLGAGAVAEPAAPKGPTASDSLHYVDVKVDAATTNARGLQILTVHLKIQPTHRIYQTKGGVEVFSDRRAITMKLAVKTQDPKTQVDVLYPKGHENGLYSAYADGEVAIQVIIQRAKGDQSPVQGQLDFRVMGTFF